jgi:diacylglycerol O-acyltransferase / wax synthase
MAIDRLSADDELTLRTDEIWPQDIGALAVLDGSGLLDGEGLVRMDLVREAIGSRLHLVPRFRQLIHVPRRGLGGPLWVDDPDFDLSEHVGVLPLPVPGGEGKLLLAVERLRRRRLDRLRPLWEMWFLPGLAEGRVGWFVRMHHALADGMAAMATIGTLLDAVPEATIRPGPPWTPGPLPRAGELLADDLRRRAAGLVGGLGLIGHPWAALGAVLSAWPAMRELLAEEPSPRTSLDRLIGPDRSLALVRSSLASVKEVGHVHDATVNDVLLAATAGALRALLVSRGEPVEDAMVRVYVPVSLRRGQDDGGPRLGPPQGNLIGQMVVPVKLASLEPGDRLRRIAAETSLRKARARPSLGRQFRSRIVSRLLLKAIVRQRINVATANVPGPEAPLYLAGARVLEVFPMLNLIGNVTLGVGALSYAGAFDIGVIADLDAYPDLDVFAAGLRDELHALGVSSLSAQPSTPVPVR